MTFETLQHAFSDLPDETAADADARRGIVLLRGERDEAHLHARRGAGDATRCSR